jgi:hypothetical protein
MTLGGVIAVLVISFSNWREIDRIQQSLDVRLGQLDNRVAQIVNRPAAPAPRAAAGGRPDPNRVYAIKTAGMPFKGPEKAPVTIAEFSDFQ